MIIRPTREGFRAWLKLSALGAVLAIGGAMLLPGIYPPIHRLPPLRSADRAVVRIPGQADREIRSPAAIVRLQAFANARLDRWRAVAYQTPAAPHVSVTFYRGGTFLDSFGAGSGFFLRRGTSIRTRKAGTAELREFRVLVDETADRRPSTERSGQGSEAR